MGTDLLVHAVYTTGRQAFCTNVYLEELINSPSPSCVAHDPTNVSLWCRPRSRVQARQLDLQSSAQLFLYCVLFYWYLLCSGKANFSVIHAL